ncbi:MAG: TIGR04282 family arsenosugar biosynthesis glycosyltransferase [Microcoleaceae cyanobacterium]
MEHLIIFSRYPQPGKTKTRLIPALGEAGAALLHRQMAQYAVKIGRELIQSRSISLEVRYTGGTLSQMQDWLGTDLVYNQQGTGDLGDRMNQSFQAGFDSGKSAIIIIGTDCIELNADILSQGFETLKQQNLVIGTAQDGGYYLIGLRRLIPELFQGIDWGTERVLQQTLDRCKPLNLSIGNLPQLSDIDRPEDLNKISELDQFKI